MYEFFVYLILAIITIAAQKKPPDAKAAGLEELDVPVAEDGRALPVIFGRVRMKAPNVVWYGDMETRRIRKRSGFSKVTVGHKYFLKWQMVFCHGPVNKGGNPLFAEKPMNPFITGLGLTDLTLLAPGSYDIPFDDGNFFGGETRGGGISGILHIRAGWSDQMPAPQYKNGITDNNGYRGVVTVDVYKNGSPGGIWIGNSEQLRLITLDFERTDAGWDGDVWYPEKLAIARTPTGTEAYNDVNFAHIVYECLTNRVWGMGGARELIDDASFRACADKCYTEGLGGSFKWEHEMEIKAFIDRVCEHMGGGLRWNETIGKWQLVLLRGDYDPATLPLYTPSNSKLISYETVGNGERVNEITLKYTDPRTFEMTSFTAQDLGNQMSQDAQIPMTLERPGLTDAATARAQLTREIFSRVSPMSKIKIEVFKGAGFMGFAGVFKYQEPLHHPTPRIYRALKVSKGDVETTVMVIEAVADVWAESNESWLITEPPVNPDPDPPPPDNGDDDLTGPAIGNSNSTTPPVSPDPDTTYIPAPGSTGAWAGHDGEFADYDPETDSWSFTPIPDHTFIYDETANRWYEYVGGVQLPPPWIDDILTTKGDLIVFDGTDYVRQPVGDNDQILSVDSSSPTGLAYIDPPESGGGGGEATGGLLFATGIVPSTNTIANTATETLFNSTYVIPLAKLASGYVLKIKGRGVYGTAAAAGTLRIRIKLGGTTILDSLAFTATNSVPAGSGWNFEGEVIVISGGSGGNVEAQGEIKFWSAAAASQVMPLYNAAPVAVDLSASKALTVTAQWGTANAANSITLRQLLLWAETTGTAATSDVVALLHFDFFDGKTQIVDEAGHTWTVAGNAQIDTAFSVFGGSALLLDGTGDYIECTHADFAFGAGDFCIETRVRHSNTSGNRFICSLGGGWGVYQFSGTWAIFDGVSNNPILGGSCAINTTYHVAWTRRNGVMYLFVNGALIGSSAQATNFSTGLVRIGAQPSGSGAMAGWLDEFRIRRNYVYDVAFTPTAGRFDSIYPTSNVFEDLFNGSSMDPAWTSLNASGLTPTVSGGLLDLDMTGTSSGLLRGYYVATDNSPIKPRHYRIKIGSPLVCPPFHMSGIVIRNSATGNWMCLGLHQAGLKILTFGPSGYTGTPWSDSLSMPIDNHWLEIKDDGVTLTFGISSNGEDGTFFTLFTQPKATYISVVNQVGFGFHDGAGSAAQLIVDTFQLRQET